jgi:hypothetical protein
MFFEMKLLLSRCIPHAACHQASTRQGSSVSCPPPKVTAAQGAAGLGCPQQLEAAGDLDFDGMLAALETLARQRAWRSKSIVSAGRTSLLTRSQHDTVGVAGGATLLEGLQPEASVAGADAGVLTAEDALMPHLLRELPDLLMTHNAPMTSAFVEWLHGDDSTANKGSGTGSLLVAHGSTLGVVGCSWPDVQLLALYKPECLGQLLEHSDLLRALFCSFASCDGTAPANAGGSGKRGATAPAGDAAELPRLLSASGAVRLVQALGVVAPSPGCRALGGRGLTVMEALQAAWACRPPRLQGGPPKAPEPLTLPEFAEWAGRCALLAFGWRGGSPTGGGGGVVAGAPLEFGPATYSPEATRLWMFRGCPTPQSHHPTPQSHRPRHQPRPGKEGEQQMVVEGPESGGSGLDGFAWGSRKRLLIQECGRHQPAFSSAWVGAAPEVLGAGSASAHCTPGAQIAGQLAEQAARAPFDTITSMAGIPPMAQSIAQGRALARASREAAVAGAELAAQRVLRLAAQRLAVIEARAAAAGRREDLQRRAGQQH